MNTGKAIRHQSDGKLIVQVSEKDKFQVGDQVYIRGSVYGNGQTPLKVTYMYTKNPSVDNVYLDTPYISDDPGLLIAHEQFISDQDMLDVIFGGDNLQKNAEFGNNYDDPTDERYQADTVAEQAALDAQQEAEDNARKRKEKKAKVKAQLIKYWWVIAIVVLCVVYFLKSAK